MDRQLLANKTLKRRSVGVSCATFATGIAWVVGLLLAGSDGEWMPWGNIAGVIIFMISSWRMTHHEIWR